MLQDLRLAFRLFKRSPGFCATVVSTLALGIGLTSAMFSVVDGVLLRPLPYERPSQLVTTRTVTVAALGEWRSRTSALSALAAYDFSLPPLLLVGEDTARLRQAAVTANFLSVLGVRPVLGRAFDASDAIAGAEPAVVLTYRAWQEHFGGRSNAIGQLAPFEPVPLRVIGVLPPTFIMPMRSMAALTELRMLTLLPANPGIDRQVTVVARLHEGSTLAQARSEESAIVQSPANQPARQAEAVAVSSLILGQYRSPLLFLFGAVGFLLLIACANVGNLVFARELDARRELAVRLALGARRYEILRLVLVQSCVLAVTGGALGVLAAYWSFGLFSALVPGSVPRADAIQVDARVLGFALLVSLSSGVIIGSIPALRLSRSRTHGTLRIDGRTPAPSQRLRLTIVTAEVALSVILLAGAGLAGNSFIRLLNVDLGFAPDEVLSLRLRAPAARYPTSIEQKRFLDAALERLAAMPAVSSVGVVDVLPVTRARNGVTLFPLTDSSAAPIEVEQRVIASDYFKTIGAAIVHGRAFDRRDSEGGARVAIINDAVAQRLWPGRDPVGLQLRYENQEPREVVGVVRDIRAFAVDTSAEPQIYIPHTQSIVVPQQLVIRMHGSFDALAPLIRRELRTLEPRVLVESVQPLSRHVALSIAQPRFQAWLLGIFGASGLLLVAIGIGGLISYSVARRTREVGIRIALGATPSAVVRTVVGAAMAAVVAGLTIGLVGSVALGRTASAYLFEVQPNDPWTHGAVLAVLGVTTALAAWLPARRALRIDPAVALRAE